MNKITTTAVALTLSLGAPLGAARAEVIRAADGPFITGGAFYVARDKGYFKKLGLDVETKQFADGALAVPSLISGELDITFMTAAASLFNSVAKGAPLVVILPIMPDSDPAPVNHSALSCPAVIANARVSPGTG